MNASGPGSGGSRSFAGKRTGCRPGEPRLARFRQPNQLECVCVCVCVLFPFMHCSHGRCKLARDVPDHFALETENSITDIGRDWAPSVSVLAYVGQSRGCVMRLL